MDNFYMNRVFLETFEKNFKPSSGKHVPREYWMCDEVNKNDKLKEHNLSRRAGNKGYFSKEEEYQLRLIGERKGFFQTVDATGQVLSKEQELINRKVKHIMIKAGLMDDDRTLAEQALAERVPKIETETPYKINRPRVKRYERPEKIQARVKSFRTRISIDRTQKGSELAQMLT